MRIDERLGFILGYPLGIVTGTVSFFRNARMFHPCGELVRAQVKELNPSFLKLHPHVMMRFSSAIWKHKEWPDVLGITLRFGRNESFNEKVSEDDQDLLFASFKRPWQTPIGPLLTRYKNFFENDYYAISPFEVRGREIYLKISPVKTFHVKRKRETILKENVEKQAVLRMWFKEKNKPWKPLADLALAKSFKLDQKTLFFNPFNCGLKIYPRGFIHYLRKGAYRLSQDGRSFRHHLNNKFVTSFNAVSNKNEDAESIRH
ncbi:MAG: hypothetical protein ACLGHN_02405 [Bacteriovoracia bacterium]